MGLSGAERVMDYTRCEEEVMDHSSAPCTPGKLIASEDMNHIVYASYPVSIRFSRNKGMEMTTDISEVNTYADMLSVLSVDEKEEGVVKRMRERGYSLIGQRSKDGKPDEYAQTYMKYVGVKYMMGVTNGFRLGVRNQERYEGGALIFAKIPHFTEIRNQILLSVDDKERKTIGAMKNVKEKVAGVMKYEEYSLVGQLNADGSYDDHVKKYIRHAGTNEGLRSRSRNQKALMGHEVNPGFYYAKNEEELKKGAVLKNDGTAFIFAKTSEFKKVMEKMNENTGKTEDIIKVGSRIPGTDDIITEIGTINNIRTGVRMVQVNYQKKWIPLDIKTGERILEIKQTIPIKKGSGMNVTDMIMKDPVHNGAGMFDGLLSRTKA